MRGLVPREVLDRDEYLGAHTPLDLIVGLDANPRTPCCSERDHLDATLLNVQRLGDSRDAQYLRFAALPLALFGPYANLAHACAARKPSVIDMEDLDIAIHSWDINPEHIEICKRPSGRPWMLGSGVRPRPALHLPGLCIPSLCCQRRWRLFAQTMMRALRDPIAPLDGLDGHDHLLC